MAKKYIINNENKPYIFPTVLKIFRRLPLQNHFSYENFTQTALFPLLEDAVFQKQFPAKTRHKTYLTNGAKSGFIATVLQFSKKYDTVIIPAPMWPGYKRVCAGLERKIEMFPLINETQQFNLWDFMKKAKNIAQVQKTIIVVLNTPCHNPTGYSLTSCEIKKIITFLNEISEEYSAKIILYLDMVCMDYEPNFLGNNYIFEELNHISKNILVLAQYSMSKALGMFGTGIGSITGITKNKELFHLFNDKMQTFSVCLTSNTNTIASDIFKKIYTNEERKAHLHLEQNMFAVELKERALIFQKEAENYGIQTLPYKSGWRICMICQNADEINKRLNREEVYSFKKGLAVSLYQLPQHKIAPLVQKIYLLTKEVFGKYA